MSRELRLLQIEDSESDAELIVRLLVKAGYTVHATRVEEYADLVAALAEKAWDVIISDHGLPALDAFTALRALQETGKDIPFIVVSGSIGEDFAVATMKAGAHDYLMKSNLARLAPAVEREIKEARSRQERREAECALRDSEERLALAISATQLGTFDYLPQSGKLVLSETARKHFGLSGTGAANLEALFDALHGEDRESLETLFRDILRSPGGGEFAAECRVTGIDDNVERQISTWGRVYFEETEPRRFVGVTLDITERKRLESQFLQAQKLEGIGRLAGGVAHDFNNLLTVITGYAQMVLDGLPAEHSLRSPMEQIDGAARRATDLTRQLLMFSRRESRQTKTLVLNDVVRNFDKMLRRLIGEDVQLTLSLDPGAGAFRADAGQIEQVIMNLVVNAKDAMPDGGTLFVETAPFSVDSRFAHRHISVPPGDYVMLSISDTGVGMPPEVQARIFEPFFTTKEVGKGTGLGLSTVYGIVLQSGGTISVYSEPDLGTTFRILFPAVSVEIHAPAAAEAKPVLNGTETVLLAEDEPGVRKYIRQILQQYGYQVLEASCGREALEISRGYAGTIHLLLTDTVMPEMNGMELSRLFSADRPDVPVLSMSGYSDRFRAQDGISSNYIDKPFTPTALLSRIRALLSATGSAQFDPSSA